MEDKYKAMIGVTACICVTSLQLYAWSSGHNGVVFATTSAILGGAGVLAFNIKQSIKEYVNK